MKNKIFKILGVAVSLALVASLCVFAIPGATPAEAGAPGKHKWSAQTLPTSTSVVLYSGSNVTDFAVASDGLTIYVANDGVMANLEGAVLLSTDGGQSFKKIAISSVSDTAVMTSIAVAPDDAGVVAVVASEGEYGGSSVVWMSTNSGKTWTSLPTAYADDGSGCITDIDVGPARSGCVFGREFVVSMVDPVGSQVTGGDVQIIGKKATWGSVSSNDVAGQYDYMSVKFSPNFVGDRTIACVGTTYITGDVVIHLVNDAQKLEVSPTPVGVGITSVNDYGASANATLTADIAIPSDFDPTVSSLQRTYIAFASATTTDNDVYRITGSSVRDLDGVTAKAIKSITLTGEVDEGTLWLGEYLDENVKYTLDPTVSIPTWKSTKKAPSADPSTTNTTDALTIVRVSPADASVVFAGTSSDPGDESAFSVSNDAAVSFNQESLIDVNSDTDVNDVQTVDDIYLTPDGETIFMVTNDGAELSLWKSALPTGSTSWSRVKVETMAGTRGMVRLNPDYADTPAVYLADIKVEGKIYYSSNGGDTWSARRGPDDVTPSEIVVENATTAYLASGSSVYKSTNGAWTWGTPISAKVTTIRTLAMAASYPALPEEGVLLVGGTGACSYSTDGGTTFTKIATGLTSGNEYQILAHEDYATNDTIYCGDSSATDTYTYRWVIDESTAWEDLATDAVGTSSVSGLGMVNGVLYALQSGDDGAMRTLYPTAAVPLMAFEPANIAVGDTLDREPSALRVATGSDNILYAIDTSPTQPTDPDKVYAYRDMLAVDVPILTAPADGTAIEIDPVTGYAEDIQFAWEAMGSGTGMANSYDIHIAVAGTSFRAPYTNTFSPTYPTNPQTLVGVTGTWELSLMANTDYEWRIRARDQVSGDSIRSGYSKVRSFSVQAGGRVEAPHAGPLLLGPVGGATDVSLTPGFSWAPIARATEYEFILASDAGLTNTIAGTPVTVTMPSFQCTEKLAYGTVYFWAVKATKPTVSPQAIGSFTTMGEPVKPVAPVEILPPAPAPEVPPTPGYIWAIIGIGAVLAIVVIVLIVRTRRVV